VHKKQNVPGAPESGGKSSSSPEEERPLTRT